MKDLKIFLCMGSSCYARGNARNAELVQEWLAQHPGSTMELSGTLCEGLCKEGPVMRVDDRLYTRVSPDSLGEILGKTLSE